ncbi:MAG: glycosyltransferase family 9 protein, partial [Anaerolineae bacterium]
MGDVLLSTPLVAAMRRAYPQARLDYAVGPWSRPLLETNPHLDSLLDCGPVGSGRYGWRDYWALVQR